MNKPRPGFRAGPLHEEHGLHALLCDGVEAKVCEPPLLSLRTTRRRARMYVLGTTTRVCLVDLEETVTDSNPGQDGWITRQKSC